MSTYVDIIQDTLEDFWKGLLPLTKTWEKEVKKAAKMEGVHSSHLPYMAYSIWEAPLPPMQNKHGDVLRLVLDVNHHAESWPIYSKLKNMRAIPPVEVEARINKAIVRLAKSLYPQVERQVTKAWRKALNSNKRKLYRRYKSQFDTMADAMLRLWELCEYALNGQVRGFNRYVEGEEPMRSALATFLTV